MLGEIRLGEVGQRHDARRKEQYDALACEGGRTHGSTIPARPEVGEHGGA
jgi:hypothetical protein